MTKWIAFNVPLDTYVKLRTLAAARNLSIKHTIIDLIQKFFQEDDSQKILKSLSAGE